MGDVRLVDLDVFKRYSLAIRQEAAPAEEVLAVLEATRRQVLGAGGAVPPRPAPAAEPWAPAGAEEWAPAPDVDEWVREEEAEAAAAEAGSAGGPTGRDDLASWVGGGGDEEEVEEADGAGHDWAWGAEDEGGDEGEDEGETDARGGSEEEQVAAAADEPWEPAGAAGERRLAAGRWAPAPAEVPAAPADRWARPGDEGRAGEPAGPRRRRTRADDATPRARRAAPPAPEPEPAPSPPRPRRAPDSDDAAPPRPRRAPDSDDAAPPRRVRRAPAGDAGATAPTTTGGTRRRR